MNPEPNRRILLVDDNTAIHEDFRKILSESPVKDAQLKDAMAGFFGAAKAVGAKPKFELDSAFQGQEALKKVEASIAAGRPYAMAFVDVRMPPGWDGIDTIARLWEVDPELQAVVCTAYADYSWDQMIAKLGYSDRLLILKKPFDPLEVQQIATALTEKWNAGAREKARFEEARAAEQEAKAYAASLVMTNRALETARAGAVAAAQAKTEFLANMSHELRTPMIAVLGHADLLSDREMGEDELQEHISTIREQGMQLLSLLSDILDIASCETGRITIEAAPCSVRTMLNEVRERFMPRAAAKSLGLTVVCADSVPRMVSCDVARLRQVMQHLVGNGIKFTDKGTVKISASLTAGADSEAGRLRISVEDTGVGITSEQRSRLFEAFAQADGSLTRRHGGAGLGLALSRRLAQTMGGDLDVESQPGKGSRFTLTIPVQSCEMNEPPAPFASKASSEPEPRLRARVLLAEDVVATQRLYSLYLRRAGADVDVADNGKIAVDRVTESMREGRPYDLVLMDMQMPVMDGYTATRELRSAGFRGPILAVTAHALTGDREKCIDAGCDDYVTKPTDRDQLVAVSKLWIAKSIPPALPAGADAKSRIQNPT
ncbi:MAG: response regulator [Planctomycetes bacterium]|nr:response regulator [Planctomycetota bacterium]